MGITERQTVINKIAEDVQPQLKKDAKSAPYITKLIVQGLLMLLEEQVTIRCRKEDEGLVKGCLAGAQTMYTDQIKAQSGAAKQCKLTLDSTNLEPNCIGGVLLACKDGRIVIDNTLDARLKLVM